MTLADSAFGIVVGEKPPVRHLFGTVSGRSCCGKQIVRLPAGKPTKLVLCGRCISLDKARRAGMPDWY